MARLTRAALGLASFALLAAALGGCKGVRRTLVDVLDDEYQPPDGTLDAPTFNGPDEDRDQLVLSLVPLAEGFQQITDAHFVPGDPEMLLVVEKRGRVQWLDLGTGERGELLRVPVVQVSEQGLLGLAFHPDFPVDRRFYLNYTPDGVSPEVSRVAEWTVGPIRTSTAVEAEVLLEVEQPYQNHNAGQLAFGPDGMLYVGWGDGGFRADPDANGQDPTTFLGAMLRIDVDGRTGDKPYGIPADNPWVDDPAVPDEVWAYGLRNPWRYGFAPDGRLVVADVGQDQWEEIDVVRAGDNLGWNVREARHCFPPGATCDPAGLREPVYEYGRTDGNSVTGGFVYTGTAIPELSGRYVFGDFVTGRIWAIDLPEGEPGTSPLVEATALGKWPLLISTFARDDAGEIYVADYGSGFVYRLAPPTDGGGSPSE